MSRRRHVGLGALIALVLLLPLVAAVLVRRDVAEAREGPSTLESLAADSAAGDSAAFATLPAGLGELFGVRHVIARPDAPTLRLHECIQLPARRDDELRRRLQVRFTDSTAAVVYAVADPLTGALQRVEFLHRTPTVGQRGFIWERARDRTVSVWWFEGPGSRRLRREERGDVPRGGPVPRAVRGLGRQLLVAPCADSSANSPMNPISGSRN